MRPEKRRAGRAIRKARREQREAVAVAIPQIMEIWSNVVEGIAAGFQALGEAALATSRAMRGTPERKPPALPALPRALPPAGPGLGDPSQSGGEALRSALRAYEDDRPFEGIGDD